MASVCGPDARITLYVEVQGLQRMGPSYCMQNTVIGPLVLIILCGLAYWRGRNLLSVHGGNPRPKFDGVLDKIQLGSVLVGIIRSLVALFQGKESSDVSAPGLVSFSLHADARKCCAVQQFTALQTHTAFPTFIAS